MSMSHCDGDGTRSLGARAQLVSGTCALALLRSVKAEQQPWPPVRLICGFLCVIRHGSD